MSDRKSSPLSRQPSAARGAAAFLDPARDPSLLKLDRPDDWRIDASGHCLVHRVRLQNGSAIYTLYEIRRMTWRRSIEECLAEIERRARCGWRLRTGNMEGPR